MLATLHLDCPHKLSPTFYLKVICLENVHYKSASGDIECGYNVLEINILMHEETEDPVGFGIQVQNENGQIIQTCVILQPFQYKN